MWDWPELENLPKGTSYDVKDFEEVIEKAKKHFGITPEQEEYLRKALPK